MPTPDDLAGGLTDADEILVNDTAADPSGPGRITYNGGSFKAEDGSGVFNLRSGSGLSAADHKVLRQLIHFIDDGPAEGFTSGAYREVIGGLFPTSIVWWESASKLKKIVEKTITRSGGGATNLAPTPIAWKV